MPKITELVEKTSPLLTDLLVLVDDPSGSPITKKATIDNILKSSQSACFSDRRTFGTNGGSASAATWHTRTLNYTEFNTITGCSIASNQITLPAGTYRIKASAPALRVNQHKIAFRNITDATYSIPGTSECALATDNVANRSFLNSQITISVQKIFELWHYCTIASATNGLGDATNVGTMDELYAIVEIERIA